MKKMIVLLTLILAGCSTLYLDTSDLLRDQNKENLKKLSVGQPKNLVMDLMGRDPSKGIFMWIDNPYRVETLTDKDGETSLSDPDFLLDQRATSIITTAVPSSSWAVAASSNCPPGV